MLVSRLETESVSNGWLISVDHAVCLLPSYTTSKQIANSSFPSRLPRRPRRRVLQRQDLRLLHSRYLPAIRPCTSQLRYSHPRRPLLCRSSTNALCWCNSVLRSPQIRRTIRTMGCSPWSRRRIRTHSLPNCKQRHGHARHRYRCRRKERPRHAKRR